MPTPTKRRILTHVIHKSYQPRTVADLIAELGVASEEKQDFEQAVKQMIDEGQVVLGSADTVSLPPPGKEMTGSFRRNKRGFGFILPDSPTEHGDLFVPAPYTSGALSGDRVRAQVIRERGRGGGARSPYTGRIVEITQRKERNYVGSLIRRGSTYTVAVDGNAYHQPILIRDPSAKNATLESKVVVEIVKFPEPDSDSLAEGVIVDVLGELGEPDVETRSVMRAYGLPDDFPSEVVAYARTQSAQFGDGDPKQHDNREDLTDLLITTIDPPDARDFDDAISITQLDPSQHGGACYELGVHIADVAHFVQPGTPLDDEAKLRGNSCYLPRRVVPMLPELLSNGVCSLQEGVNRFTKTAFIRYDENAQVINTRFCRSVIRSTKRFTYLEAQAVIDDDLREACKHTKTEAKYPRPIIEQLKLMNQLARLIRARRLESGMVVLDLPEANLVFDDSGRMIDAVQEDDAFTHQLIEAFMVEANEASARLFNDLNIPMIRRVHPDPPSHDLTELRLFARVAGFNVPADPSKKELQQLLDAARGKPSQHAVHLAVLRTLSKAEYSPLLIGHFALGSDHYTHFTSPIRRYPDLIVHRGLDVYLDLTDNGRKKAEGTGKALKNKMVADPRVPNETQLVEMGRHCSDTERNAEAAERELRQYFILDMMTQYVGDDYDGTVTGMTGQGLFIQIDRYLVDGFVKIMDIPGSERWQLNRQTGALVAHRSGKTIQIGDRMVVRISRIDPPSRQLDLAIIHGIGRSKSITQSPDAASTSKNKSDKKFKPKHNSKPSGHKKSLGGKSSSAKNAGQTPKKSNSKHRRKR